MSRDLVLVFGGTGAIGKPLLAALTQKHGPHTCVVAMRRTPLAADLPVIGEMNVDLRDAQSVERVVCKYAARIRAIWNLAAPLSVDTAANPEVAEDVTVNGMSRLIAAMNAAQLPDSTLLLFSDSIGSFGADAPRENVDAAWLVSHPDQDPGSDYGRQKRRCRELMAASRFDTRFVVIPGVLHADPQWGGGTTEYALDALKQYHQSLSSGPISWHCPVRLHSSLPMIFIDDLIDAMVAITDAPRADLNEPQAGYALAGFSFSAAQLFAYLQSLSSTAPSSTSDNGVQVGGLSVTFVQDGPAARFADLWPNSLSDAAALRDLKWRATKVSTMEKAVDCILQAHTKRAQ